MLAPCEKPILPAATDAFGGMCGAGDGRRRAKAVGGGGGRDGKRDAAEAAVAGLSPASLIDATARTAAGIGPDEDRVGADAEACLRDGAANGIGWARTFTADRHIVYRFG